MNFIKKNIFDKISFKKKNPIAKRPIKKEDNFSKMYVNTEPHQNETDENDPNFQSFIQINDLPDNEDITTDSIVKLSLSFYDHKENSITLYFFFF